MLMAMPYFRKCGQDVFVSCFEGRGLAAMQNNLQMVRARNLCLAALYLPLCLVLGYYRIFDLDLFDAVPDELRILPQIGLFTFYFLLRTLMYALFQPRRDSREGYRLARGLARNAFLPMTAAALTAAGLLSLFRPDAALARQVILGAILLIYIIYLFRLYQILRTSYSRFSTFLYLCGLEFLPTGLTVALIEWF